MYVCMYVCMCMCMCARTCVRVRVRVCEYMRRVMSNLDSCCLPVSHSMPVHPATQTHENSSVPLPWKQVPSFRHGSLAHSSTSEGWINVEWYIRMVCDSIAVTKIHKNTERHTAHTIVSWPNPKQWVIVHTSDLMMIIRQSLYILSIITRERVNWKHTVPRIL